MIELCFVWILGSCCRLLACESLMLDIPLIFDRSFSWSVEIPFDILASWSFLIGVFGSLII